MRGISARVVGILVVGLLVLSALTAIVAPLSRAAGAPSEPTTGSVDLIPDDSASPDVAPQQTVDTSWLLKLDSDTRAQALRGSKALTDVIIYANDMAQLTPLLEKYGVVNLPEEFRGQVSRGMARTPTSAGGLVSTQVTVPEYALADFARLSGVLGIERNFEAQPADYTNFELTADRESLRSLSREISANPGGSEPLPLDWGTVQAQHATDAWSTSTGDGVYVAVQDWGTDFAHPNLAGRWATVQDPSSPYYGWPIMHSQNSLWLELSYFTTTSDWDRYPYPGFATVASSSWFSDTSYVATEDAFGNLTYATGSTYGFYQVTKRQAPSAGCPGGSSMISRVYTVGDPAAPYHITSVSGVYHLGINKDKYLEALWCERPGILVVDSTTAGVYDTVYVDLNDDYNFTNDKPVSIADPLSGWDINSDGYYDVSGGLLYYVANDLASVTDEAVIASATGTETSASLANGWIESDVVGTNLYGPTLALDGLYWPGSGEDIWEQVISSTTGTEQGTSSQLTFGYNVMTGAGVDTASLLAAGYPVWLVYDIYNGTRSLVEGVDYTLNMATGEITWLVNFEPGDTVEIIYQLETWTINYDSGEITFQTPPTAGSAVTATYNSGLPVPYANITAQRQGWDLFVPGPGDLVAFYGPFETGEEHGTWVATSLAGNPVGNFYGLADTWGTAPDVKIIGVDLPTAADDAELFWFSSHGYDGVAGTGDEAQIATNSWGYIQPQETGFTSLERYLYDLTTNEVPDFTILFASGNLGPGYATSTPPNTAPGVITVGGGTLMNYRTLFGYDGGIAYYDLGLFGTGLHGVGPYGDVVDFSSKGPTLMGTPEPDVFAVGAFAIGGRPLNSACLAWYCGGLDAWDLWSGTSLSTPVAAGVVALIYQAYDGAHGGWPTSVVAKEILMSSADDHGYDVLQQGAGWVNASAAVDLASMADGTLRVSPSFLAPGGYEGVHRDAFVNLMSPGDSDTQTVTVTNEGTVDATLDISDAMYAKSAPDYTFTWDFQADAGARDWRVLKPSGLYAADGVTQLDATDLSAAWNSADFIRITFVRDPAVLTAAPDTFIELFDWYNYAHLEDNETVAESTITHETSQVLMTGVYGETKAFANAPVLPGYTFYREAAALTETASCASISTTQYTFDPTTGEINLCAPLADGEHLNGTYDWYVPVLAGSTFDLAYGDLVPASWTVFKNGALWGTEGAEWDVSPVDGVFTLNVDLNPGDLLTITYTWDDPAFNSPLEQNRFTFAGQTGGASATIELYDPAGRVDDGLAISFRDFGGAKGLTPVILEFYQKADWAWADAEVSTGLLAPAGGSASFDVTFGVPSGTQAGMYQGAIVVTSGTWTSLVPVLITVPYTGFPITLGGDTPTTTLYDNNGVSMGQIPGNWRQIGDSRLFWADFSAASAANRRMIYTLLMEDLPSQGVITVYSLQPDPVFSDDAVYGPGTMVEVASNEETMGATNALALNRQFLHTDIMSGPLAIQMKAMNSLRADEPFTLEIGYMETNPTEVRVSSNELMGTTHVTVTSNVPLHDGLGMATLEAISTVETGLAVDPYPYPGGDFQAYLYGSSNRYKTIIPSGTIVATWSMHFYNGARDSDFGIFYDDNCDGVYTVADSAVGSAAATSANPETATLSFPPAGCYWVHAAGYDVDPGSLFDLTLDISKIGVSAYSAVNAPSTTVPASAPTGFDLAWNFPVTKAEGVTTDYVFLSPGFTPFALAQQLLVVFSYDLTPPSFSSPLPAPDSVTADSRPPIFIQINDNQAGAIVARGEIDRTRIGVWLDGTDISSVATISVPHVTNTGYTTGTVLYVPSVPLSEGPHTIRVQAGDFAGNMVSTSWSFTVDTTAPPLRVDSPVPGLVTAASSIEIAGTSEPGASVTVGGQAVPTNDLGRFATTVALSAGENAFEVTAADALGNMASTTVTVVRDNTAPALSLLRTSTGLLTNRDVTLVSGVVSEPASVTVAGIPAMVHADGSFEVPVSLVEGTNTLSIQATDLAGNAATASLTVVRDTTPPMLSVDGLPTETSGPTVTVSGTVEAGISFVTVNGAPVPVTGGQYSTDVALSYGANTIFVTATDAAGNPTTMTATVSYIPTGVNTATVGLVLLPVLAVVGMLVGLLIGQMMRGRKGGPPEETTAAKEEPAAEEELPPPEGGGL